MKLEETIQTILDKHPTLFGDRKSVLIYLYCYFGTGYEWIDGELVSEETKGKFEGRLCKNGLAKQRLSEEKACIQYAYKCLLNKHKIKEEKKVSLLEFQEKIIGLKVKFIEKGKEHGHTKKYSIDRYKEYVLQPYLNAMRDIRSKYIDNLDKMISKEYSPIYNIPTDIKEDWLQGLNEVKSFISFKAL